MAIVPALPATVVLGFRRPDSRAETPIITSLRYRQNIPRTIRQSFRLRDVIDLHSKRGVPTVFASGTSLDSDASKFKIDRSSSGGPNGPPPLTILAGVIVFLLVSWVVGSFVMWLVSLIVRPS